MGFDVKYLKTISLRLISFEKT